MPEIAPAPAAAPAAAPAPAPAPAPATPATPPAKPAGNTSGAGKPAVASAKPVSKPADDLKSAYDQLDQMAARGEAPEIDAAPAAPVPGDETPEAGAEPAPADPPAKPEKAATLRQSLDATKTELQKAQARIKELETAKPADDPEKKTLAEKLTQREKKLAELEDELRFTNYERSTDYKDKYETPFIDAYTAGRNKVTSFKLVDANGNERQGTAQDFDSFMRITDDNDAAERAAEMFGNKAPMVMYHREQVNQLNAARARALDEYRKTGGEREKQRVELTNKHRAELAALWESEAKSAVENPKYKPWFKAAEGDTVGAELLERGFEFADEAFGKVAKDGDGKPIARSPQEVAKMHAVVRNKAAAFDYQIHRNQLLQKANRELKKKLAGYDASVPGNGNGRGQTRPALSGWAAVEADLARRADR